VILLVYSENTGRLRRIIRDLDKTEAQILAQHPMVPGEASIDFDGVDLPSLGQAQAAVDIETETSPVDDRYVQVVNDHITGIIYADEVIDTIPSGWFKNQDARMGYRKLSDNSFVRSSAELDRLIIDWQRQIDILPTITDPPLTPAEIDQRQAALDQEIAAALAEKART